MDPIKESLIQAANITDDMQLRVQNNVTIRLHKKKKFHIPLWVPTLAVVACALFFVFNFMSQKSSVETYRASALQENDLIFLAKMMQNGSSTHLEKFQYEYIAEVALPFIAEEMNLKLNHEEIQADITKNIKEMIDADSFKLIEDEQLISNLEKIYIPHITYASSIEDAILESLKTNYPNFSLSTIKEILYYDAIERFITMPQAKYFGSSEQLTNILNYTNKHETLNVIQVKDDYAIAVRGVNLFSLDTLSAEQIASFNDAVYKIPLSIIGNIPIGTTVEVSFYQEAKLEGIQEIVPKSFETGKVSNYAFDVKIEPAINNLLTNLEWSAFSSIQPTTIELSFNINDNLYLVTMSEQFNDVVIYNMTNNTKAKLSNEQSEIFIQDLKSATVEFVN